MFFLSCTIKNIFSNFTQVQDFLIFLLLLLLLFFIIIVTVWKFQIQSVLLISFDQGQFFTPISTLEITVRGILTELQGGFVECFIYCLLSEITFEFKQKESQCFCFETEAAIKFREV